jgi:cell division protein FtsW (lipid II flippase)
MEALTYRHRGQAISKRIMGAVIILVGIYLLFFNSEQRELKDWILFGLMIILGVLNFTPLSGSDKSCITSGEQDLKIRWRNWYRWKLIRPDEIEKIVIGRLFILIKRKENKAVRMDVDFLEKDQKTEVYSFFIEYAKQKNLVIERHGLNQE